jgi:hypothetical protein
MNVRRWLDYWLKGVPSGIVQEKPLQMQMGDDIFSTDYHDFEDDGNWSVWRLYLEARAAQPTRSFGVLSPTKIHNQNGDLMMATADAIGFDQDPVLVRDAKDSDLLYTLGFPFQTNLSASPQSTSVIYMLPGGLPSELALCGTPKLSLRVQTNAVQWQLYGYLYDVELTSSSTLGAEDFLVSGIVLSDFDFTNWANDGVANPQSRAGRSDDRPSHSRQRVATPPFFSTILEHVEMRSLCRRVEAGHRLALGFVLFSKHREPANNDTNLSLSIVFSDDELQGNVLELPLAGSGM